jgi:cell division septation protein DedD
VATASSPAASTGTYYVVAPYSGDPSLEQARAVVPGAYVRNFQTGAAVQLGVFSSADNAQALVQELAAKGIAAEVYQP